MQSFPFWKEGASEEDLGRLLWLCSADKQPAKASAAKLPQEQGWLNIYHLSAKSHSSAQSL